MPKATSTTSVDNHPLVTIIKGIAGGSQVDLATLFDNTSDILFALVLRIVGNRAGADEVLLDIYAQVWQQSADYDPSGERPVTWLNTLARQQAVAYLQSNGPAHSTLPAQVITATTGKRGDLTSEEIQSLQAALDTLPADQRHALELAYFGGLTYHQIAAELRLAPNLIQRHIGLAMKSLRAVSVGRPHGRAY